MRQKFYLKDSDGNIIDLIKPGCFFELVLVDDELVYIIGQYTKKGYIDIYMYNDLKHKLKKVYRYKSLKLFKRVFEINSDIVITQILENDFNLNL